MKYNLLLTFITPLFVFTVISNHYLYLHNKGDINIQESFDTKEYLFLDENIESKEFLNHNYSNTKIDTIQSLNEKKPTKTPKRTPPPLIIPPPADPKILNIITFLGVLLVVIILFGVWINRKKLD
jgi:hypothetical protein